MQVGFGGNAVFNRASPSSHAGCVAQIVADYVVPVTTRPVRILDIGGTQAGFRKNASLPAGTEVIIVNPQANVGADFDYVSSIPSTIAGFDLAMLFGVMMYLSPEQLLILFQDVKHRLRGRGIFIVAEPDPEGVVGKAEIAAKTVYAAIKSIWNPTKFNFHKSGAAREILRQAGFVQIRDRPELTPNAMGVFPPPLPKYFVIAASM
jgi:hypothetical protein